MTSLRFVGDLSPWWGLGLAILVAIVAWRFYHRENSEIPGHLKVILPLLRCLAIVLGILILTGPVLHHQETIGELGKVKIFVDASNSMTQTDRHMSLVRKLRIAEQLGWISREVPAQPKAEALQNISDARVKLMQKMESFNGDEQESTQITNGINEFIDVVETEMVHFSAEEKNNVSTEIVDVMKEKVSGPVNKDQIQQLVSVTRKTLPRVQEFESAALQRIESELQVTLGSGNESIAAAVDLFDRSPRWRRVELGLADGRLNLLEKLRERHDVEVFFVHQEEPGSTAGLSQDFSFKSFLDRDNFTQATNLSSRVSETLGASEEDSDRDEENSGEEKTAIVLITDGQHNDGPSPIQTARRLGSQGKAYYNVAIGAVKPALDLAVVKLEHPQFVFAKDEVRGSMIIRDSMTPGIPFVAQVKHEDTVLWQDQLIAQNVKDRRIDFEFKVDELVDELETQLADNVEKHTHQITLEASITPLAEESESTNNGREMRLSVIAQGYKVLIMDGRSRWESRFIRNAFERDEQWEVDTIIAGETTGQKTLPRGEEKNQFPIDRNQLFGYDLIIFGEVDPELFEKKELEWLREFVEIRGGGMIFIDGLRGKLRQLDGTELEALLPVSKVETSLTQLPDSLELTPQGMEKTALALAMDKQENQEFWATLPPPHTIVPIEPTPDSETLVQVVVGEDRKPAIVSKFYGAGKVVYLAFDESWRWRYKTADLWHQRAWHQLAKFAMPQPYSASDEFVSIDTGPASYEHGEKPSIRIQLNGLDGKPNAEATVDALIWKNGKVVSSVNLIPDATVPGVYRSLADPLPSGDYEVSIRASGYNESVLKSRGQFTVLPVDSGEMSETAVNETLLNQMAEESGGKYLREEDLAELPVMLETLSHGRVVESETLLWQSYWWLGAIVLLLSIEWVLRKRAGLL